MFEGLPVQEPDPAEKFSIMHGWLVVEVDGCTCDGGGEFPHRPECGHEPLIKIADLARVMQLHREENPDERLPGLRYFNGHDGELWRVHPQIVEYFDYDDRRWVKDDDVTVDHLEMPGGDAVEERSALRPVRSLFPEGWEESDG